MFLKDWAQIDVGDDMGALEDEVIGLGIIKLPVILADVGDVGVGERVKDALLVDHDVHSADLGVGNPGGHGA